MRASSGSISPQLREWILDTARAGHGVPEVLKLLKDAGYPPAQCRSAVAEVLKIPLSSINASAPSGRRTRTPAAPHVMVDGREVRVSAGMEAPIVRVLDGLLRSEEHTS